MIEDLMSLQMRCQRLDYKGYNPNEAATASQLYNPINPSFSIFIQSGCCCCCQNSIHYNSNRSYCYLLVKASNCVDWNKFYSAIEQEGEEEVDQQRLMMYRQCAIAYSCLNLSKIKTFPHCREVILNEIAKFTRCMVKGVDVEMIYTYSLKIYGTACYWQRHFR